VWTSKHDDDVIQLYWKFIDGTFDNFIFRAISTVNFCGDSFPRRDMRSFDVTVEIYCRFYGKVWG